MPHDALGVRAVQADEQLQRLLGATGTVPTL
jgi:hypothetical protein